MSISDKLKAFDPNGVGNTSNNIFGLPFDVSESRLVFIPATWDVTTSNDAGTADGPNTIFRNSFQIDLYDSMLPDAWKQGMAMEPEDPAIIRKNKNIRRQAERIIEYLESGNSIKSDDPMQAELARVNQACSDYMLHLETRCLQYLDNGQIPFIVGGDHSVSIGLIRAIAQRYDDFGVLQIDAHADMRNAYQGFSHSHASVMRQATEIKGVSRIVQAGIRELCDEELQFISRNHQMVKTFYGHDMHRRLFEGESWSQICSDIIEMLPGKVYISFDVDGLEPACCPGTGTPVPGGITFSQAIYLLEAAFRAGKHFIGADLVETGPGTIDGIVSSRLLYRMAGMVIKSKDTGL